MKSTVLDIGESVIARDIRHRSVERWGTKRATVLIGRHEKLAQALDRIVRFAAASSPVLITGETGTGKELFARALLLMSRRRNKPFLCVNCAQYLGEQLIASELFGHRRGSFTGAIAEHLGVFEAANGGTVFLDEIGDLPLASELFGHRRGSFTGAIAEHLGVFEAANGGTVFLDEIGDLPLAAQAMLLRVLSEGEVVPVGGTTPKLVDVRIVAASSRHLDQMVALGSFRADLYYRLKCLPVRVPPLRERGEDWQLIADYYLGRLEEAGHGSKRLSREAIRTLGGHDWPGNVREVRSCVETGFYATDERVIRSRDLWEALEHRASERQLSATLGFDASGFCDRLENGQTDFWNGIRGEFLRRELNRGQVRAIVAEGLVRSLGSYKGLTALFGIAQEDYVKFTDFLRHHRLKPGGL